MQDDINMYVLCDRLNNPSFRQKLDPIAKNVFRRQKPLELVFKDISTFDAQNPIIGSLLKELDIGKKRYHKHFNKKAPNPVDIEVQSRLDALKNNKIILIQIYDHHHHVLPHKDHHHHHHCLHHLVIDQDLHRKPHHYHCHKIFFNQLLLLVHHYHHHLHIFFREEQQMQTQLEQRGLVNQL